MVWAGRETQVHRKAGIYPAIIYLRGVYVRENFKYIYR